MYSCELVEPSREAASPLSYSVLITVISCLICGESRLGLPSLVYTGLPGSLFMPTTSGLIRLVAAGSR
ncbi:hypothetical protein D3C72_1774080 [compost metagenome]